MEALKHPCKQCGKNEIIVKKATGEPLPHGLCRECFGDKIRAYHANNPKSKSKKKSKQEPKKNPTEISVDFSHYPDVFEALIERAGRQIRSVEEQIIWEVGRGGE